MQVEELPITLTCHSPAAAALCNRFRRSITVSRSKRADDHACSGRDVTNSSRHSLGILSPPRKPPRLAESALSSGESTTGDSSQQSQNSQRSQRSVVYLHAATGGCLARLAKGCLHCKGVLNFRVSNLRNRIPFKYRSFIRRFL